MKRIILFAFIAIASFGYINAQTAGTQAPQVQAKQMVTEIHKVVALHGDQFYKVNKACTDYYVAFNALQKDKGTLSPADYSTKVTTLQSTRDAAIKASLEPGQQPQFQTYLAQNKGK